MGATKRPQNKCKSCGYTWYPRGKSLSIKCPNCGGREVSTVTSWGGLAGIAFIIYAIFGSHTKPNDVATPAGAPPTVASQSSESPLDPSQEPLRGSTSEKTLVSPATPRASDDTEPGANEAAEGSPTPTSICKSEDNYFSRNSCMWRECEKSEFSDLQECADKKPKSNNYGG